MKNIIFIEYKLFIKYFLSIIFVSFIIGFMAKNIFNVSVEEWFLMDINDQLPFLLLLSKLFIISLIWYFVFNFNHKYHNLYSYLMIRYNSKCILIINLFLMIILIIVYYFIFHFIVVFFLNIDFLICLSMIFIQILKLCFIFLLSWLFRREYQIIVILCLLIFIESFLRGSWLIQFVIFSFLIIIFGVINIFTLLSGKGE